MTNLSHPLLGLALAAVPLPLAALATVAAKLGTLATLVTEALGS